MKHRSAASIVAALLSCLALAGCGGGAETKTGSGGTGSPIAPEAITVAGTLSALGPEQTAGITLQGTGATVALNEVGGRSLSDLRLGMPVDGVAQGTSQSSIASPTNLVAQSLVRGPIVSYTAANRLLQFPGFGVLIDLNTILEGVSEAELLPGRTVEVFAQPSRQPTQWYATRIAARPDSAGVTEFQGTIFSSDATSLTLTTNLRVQTQMASVSTTTVLGGPGSITPSLIQGRHIRLRGNYDGASNTFTATQVIAGFDAPRPDNQLHAIEGEVTSVVGPGHFLIQDLEIKTSLPVTNVTVGSFVRLRGRKLAGAVQAVELAVLQRSAPVEYGVTGDITQIPTPQTIVARGEAVRTTGATFINGTAADLAVGRRVQMTLRVDNGALVAREIRFL